MEDIVERVLAAEEDEDRGTPPEEVQDVSVAVVGVGRTGTGRLPGVCRRLGSEAFVGQQPDGIGAFGIDLPGESHDPDWEPAGWHVVERLDGSGRPDGEERLERSERLDRDGQRAATALPPVETDRLRGFVGSELDPYDTLVLAIDGTDRAAVSVAGDLAAAFRGGAFGPVFVVPTVPAADPPARLLAAERGTAPDTRPAFGPDVVVPVEQGRATELTPPPRGPLAADSPTDPVERAAETVTAGLVEALGTRTMFGSLADDLLHLRGRVIPHVGRRPAPERLADAEALVAAMLATPLAGTPAEWEPGGAWLSHLRTPSAADSHAEAVGYHLGSALHDRTGVDPADRPAELESYRLTDTAHEELILFRFEQPDSVESEQSIGPSDDRRGHGDRRRSIVDQEETVTFEEEYGDTEIDGGLDVVR